MQNSDIKNVTQMGLMLGSDIKNMFQMGLLLGSEHRARIFEIAHTPEFLDCVRLNDVELMTMALMYGQYDVVKLLLDSGASAVRQLGDYSYFSICMDIKTIKLLMAHRAGWGLLYLNSDVREAERQKVIDHFPHKADFINQLYDV